MDSFYFCSIFNRISEYQDYDNPDTFSILKLAELIRSHEFIELVLNPNILETERISLEMEYEYPKTNTGYTLYRYFNEYEEPFEESKRREYVLYFRKLRDPKISDFVISDVRRFRDRPMFFVSNRYPGELFILSLVRPSGNIDKITNPVKLYMSSISIPIQDESSEDYIPIELIRERYLNDRNREFKITDIFRIPDALIP